MSNKKIDDQLTKCIKCKAKCCKHIAMEIDRPTTKTDYDNIRWYLLHENIIVYIDGDKKWTLEMAAKCKNLGPDNSCLDYENRPKICREYPLPDTLCEFDGDDIDREIIFNEASEFEAYLDKKKINWKFKNLKT